MALIARTQHGALLDAELLAAVYVELTTTRQAALELEPVASRPASVRAIVRTRPNPLPPRVIADDRNAHRAFVQTLGCSSAAELFGSTTLRSKA
jgi:DNA polymerase III subunit epsilon